MLDNFMIALKNFGNVSYLINIFGVVLQYLVLIFLYLYLYKIGKKIFSSLKRASGNSKSAKQLFLKVVALDDTVRSLDVGQQIAVGGNISIGRARGNDIVVVSPVVSAEHAVIAELHGDCFVRDLDSTNGTLVNGKRISGQLQLVQGDKIAIGALQLIVVGE